MTQPQLSFDGDPNGPAYQSWREQFCREVAKVDFVPVGDRQVHRTIVPSILPRIRLSASFGTPMSFVSLGTNDELVITTSPNLALSGAMGKRPLEIAAGDITIGAPSIKGAHITQTGHGNFQTALLPRKALLRNPAMRTRKIIEIAHLAGFHDVSYFHRAFHRRFGQTPDDVRKLSGETS
ncbi:hypothetical protein XH83_32055 [Bradyrhizobium sp. CCBAU 53351]|uniref:helix-turn-helix domain-containing protein n=1 Tax=Bradyrhizobium sp. CCBAU 53351 TaxID=1325114 RepID=UPI0018890F3E|nr:helix-turn-helix domain-containing protein [Bradyrhizobium sp. CCBAU 53351]QOZ79631.1 hypothetical protein XH83_32055 [Bradyrhizobium sp. CCBAU 53351]